MRTRLMIAVTGAVVLAAAVSAHAADKTKVRFGILKTGSQTAFYVGVQKGIFAARGFDVTVSPLATGVQANQALASDQVDWSGGGIESTIVAWGNNLPFNAYSMYAKGGNSYAILVRDAAHINTPADLKGKRIAVPQGTAPAEGLDQVLKAAGLPQDSVQRVNANFGNMGPMLTSGAVDAMAGLEPFITLTQEKMNGQAKVLLRLGKYVQGGGLFLISDKWAAAHKDKMQDAVLAVWEAQQFVRHHPKESAEIESKFLKVEPRIILVAFKYLDFSPTIDAFTRKSLDGTATFLKAGGFVQQTVDVKQHLAAADAIIAELKKTYPDLLK